MIVRKKIAFSLFDIMTKNTAKVVVKDKYIKKKKISETFL